MSVMEIHITQLILFGCNFTSRAGGVGQELGVTDVELPEGCNFCVRRNIYSFKNLFSLITFLLLYLEMCIAIEIINIFYHFK